VPVPTNPADAPVPPGQAAAPATSRSIVEMLQLIVLVGSDRQWTRQVKDLLVTARATLVPVLLCAIALVLAWRFPWPQLPEILELWPVMF
jgi:hypothetical protein